MKPIKYLLIVCLSGIMYLLPSLANDLYAQRRGNNECRQQKQANGYLSIPGINEKQKQEILELQKSHQAKIKELRNEKRDTRSVEKKNSVSVKMDNQIDKHKKIVRGLLTLDQQKYSGYPLHG